MVPPVDSAGQRAAIARARTGARKAIAEMVNIELEVGAAARWKDADYGVLEALADPELIDGRLRDLRVEYARRPQNEGRMVVPARFA